MVFKEFIPLALQGCVIVGHGNTTLLEATDVFVEFAHPGDIIFRSIGFGKCIPNNLGCAVEHDE